ncbi:MAG TPA: sulfate ABC transporter permease subunit CysT [Chthoniobacteraceae bacterium]|nr:sulfate ABC transporter permease subunit CysT [Chthoniobacteraceae bacterium]
MAGRTTRRVLPGFGLSLGITLFALSAIVLVPLSAVVLKSAGLGWGGFWNAVTGPRALAAFRVSFSTSLWAALFDVFAGLLIAWVLVRYRFPGRRFFDSIVDLPFALPTAVAGISLTAIYAKNGWLGSHLYAWGIQTAFSPLGISIALAFIGLPFVVRSVQPVLADLEPEVEEASASLGAGRWTTFRRIILPDLTPALLTGFTMAFARALGEYGSVVFISGNMPMKTEILPLLIITQLEQFQYAQATALGTAMLALSFVFLFMINQLQRWSLARRGAV